MPIKLATIEVDVPDDFQLTGEFRPPRAGEWCLHTIQPYGKLVPFEASVDWHAGVDRLMLRKIKPEIRTGFINVYPNCESIYQTREMADRSAAGDRIACVEIQYEVPRTGTA